MQIVVKNGQIATSEKILKGDILIEGEKIKKVGKNIPARNIEVFDAGGLTILPGLIDIHVHFRDPGQTNKENFYTGSSAALAGGVTTVLDMPNNTVPTVTEARIRQKVSLATKKSICDFGFHFGAAPESFKEFSKVKAKVAGIKMYLNPTTGPLLLENISDIVPTFKHWQGGPILVHAEERTAAEVLGLVSVFKKQVHFCHIGANELFLVIEAKKKGLPVTCGVTPHHLFLSNDQEEKIGGFAKMRPPLPSKRDKKFLWESLDQIDIIETDHAPHTLKEKRKPFADAPNGVPGLETMLPLLLNEARSKRIQLGDIVAKTSLNPARIFKLKSKGQIKEGFDADFAIVDPSKSYIIRKEDLKTKCGWTPFNGWKVRGRVVATFLRGALAYKDGEILVKPGFGRLVKLH